MIAKVVVKNLNGTTDNLCHCEGGWLAHWDEFSGQSRPELCSASGCIEDPEVGAHVKYVGQDNDDWYIVPLCRKHNGSSNEFELTSTATPVSANISLTCGKSDNVAGPNSSTGL